MHHLRGSYHKLYRYLNLFPNSKQTELDVEESIKGRRYVEEGRKIEIAVGSPGNGGFTA